jgi:hypothetical protein
MRTEERFLPPPGEGEESGNVLRETLRECCPNLWAAAKLLDVREPMLSRLASATPGDDLEKYRSICGKLGVRFRIRKPRPLRFSVPVRALDGLWNDTPFRARCRLPAVPPTRLELTQHIQKLFGRPGAGLSDLVIMEKMRREWIPTPGGHLHWQRKRIRKMTGRGEGSRAKGYKRVPLGDQPVEPKRDFLEPWREYAFEALWGDAFWFLPPQVLVPRPRTAGGWMIAELSQAPAVWEGWARHSIQERPWGAAARVMALPQLAVAGDTGEPSGGS